MIQFVRTFSVIRAKAYRYRRGSKYIEKLYTSKPLFKIAGGKMHTPHSTPWIRPWPYTWKPLKESSIFWSLGTIY